MVSAMRFDGRRSTKASKNKIPERLYSAAEVAEALAVSKMTVLRYIDDGRLQRPSLYLQCRGYRIWLWNAREFALSLHATRETK